MEPDSVPAEGGCDDPTDLAEIRGPGDRGACAGSARRLPLELHDDAQGRDFAGVSSGGGAARERPRDGRQLQARPEPNRPGVVYGPREERQLRALTEMISPAVRRELSSSQDEARHFGPAVVAQRFAAAEAARDVHQRRLLPEQTAIITPAINARHEQRAE